MENKTTNKSTYKVDILCKNCGHCDEIDIDRGKQIEETPCPNCGCMAIKRDYNAHLKKNRKPPISFR